MERRPHFRLETTLFYRSRWIRVKDVLDLLVAGVSEKEILEDVVTLNPLLRFVDNL
jgi:hypothetical protein